MPAPQFLHSAARSGNPLKPKLLLRQKKPQPDLIILISAILNGLSLVGILTQSLVRSSYVLYVIAGSLFLFGGVSGAVAGIVGVKHARLAGRSGTKFGLYSAGVGVLLGLSAYASFMLQLYNFSHLP